MESLLDNPMKAVLYLKELTTIVQNQQSLIQTQRQRIDELERKVEDLIGENRQLRDPHHYPQQHQTPPSPSSHHPQQLQLVPTSPQSPKVGQASPDSIEDAKRSCKSLVPQTPTTLCRSVGLARKAE
ncbi:hypothetical protein LDENG_00074340 [Lucifuga dentata]|nr:hypothetical protein LDENG_00074340 [Lucifuga dentata]